MSSHIRAWTYRDLNQAVDGPLLAPSWSATTWLWEEEGRRQLLLGDSAEGGELARLVAAGARRITAWRRLKRVCRDDPTRRRRRKLKEMQRKDLNLKPEVNNRSKIQPAESNWTGPPGVDPLRDKFSFAPLEPGGSTWCLFTVHRLMIYLRYSTSCTSTLITVDQVYTWSGYP